MAIPSYGPGFVSLKGDVSLKTKAIKYVCIDFVNKCTGYIWWFYISHFVTSVNYHSSGQYLLAFVIINFLMLPPPRPAYLVRGGGVLHTSL